MTNELLWTILSAGLIIIFQAGGNFWLVHNHMKTTDKLLEILRVDMGEVLERVSRIEGRLEG